MVKRSVMLNTVDHALAFLNKLGGFDFRSN